MKINHPEIPAKVNKRIEDSACDITKLKRRAPDNQMPPLIPALPKT